MRQDEKLIVKVVIFKGSAPPYHLKNGITARVTARVAARVTARVAVWGKVLRLIKEKTSSTKELSEALGQKSISGQLKKVLSRLQTDQLVEWTEPEAKSSKQKYRIAQKGIVFLKLLDEGKTM